MAKQIIVKLWRDGVGKTLVANSQIITIDGLGSGPIAASDFADNALTGTVNTSAQRGGFYKELRSPQWILTALNKKVTAGDNITLNWAVNVANTTTVLKWYVVNVDQKILYTGKGVVTNRSVTSLPVSGLTGTFTVATSPTDVDREFEISIWNGDFGISNELARSGKITVVAKQLSVSLQQYYPFRTVIPMTIRGYPGEFVTYEGSTDSGAKGIKGNVTLDNSGQFYVADIRGGVNSSPGNYAYVFDGNITAAAVNKTLTITTEGYYLLQFTSATPSVIESGAALTVNISGAPNEVVTYTGSTTGTLTLSAGGTGSKEIIGTTVLNVGSLASWKFKGSVSANEISFSATVNALKQLNVTGTSPIAPNTAYSVTVTGKALDLVTWQITKSTIANLYLDYYETAAAAWSEAVKKGRSVNEVATFVEEYHTSIGGPKFGYLTSGAVAADYARNFSGSVTLTDIGSGDGSSSVQLVNSSGLVGRTSPYEFSFYSAATKQTKKHSVTVSRQYIMKVEGPDSVESGKPISVTVYSASGDNTVKVTGTNLAAGGITLEPFPDTGVFVFDLNAKLSSALAAGTYTFNFDSSRSDVSNAGGASVTAMVVKVTQVIPLEVTKVVGTSATGPNEIEPNETLSLTLKSSVGDVITISKEVTAAFTATNGYFDLYPDVRSKFDAQKEITDEAIYADKHFKEIGTLEGRISPTAAKAYRDSLEPVNPITVPALTKPSGLVDYGQAVQAIAKYRYPMSSPISLIIKGKSETVKHTFRVVYDTSLQVFAPTESQIESVPISIRSEPGDIVTALKISKGPDGIPQPLLDASGQKQMNTFNVGSDGYVSGDLIGGTIPSLTASASNLFYFYGTKGAGTQEVTIKGASLVVLTGKAMLYLPQGDYIAPQLLSGSAQLPNQAVWVMFKMVGGGGGGGGNDGIGVSDGRYGGTGSAGGGLRGVVRITQTGPKSLYGIVGRAGTAGIEGRASAGGAGGTGGAINAAGTLVSGNGGGGGVSGGQGSSGSGGGGGGATLLALSTGTGQYVGIVGAAGGAGGGGGSYKATNGGAGGRNVQGAGDGFTIKTASTLTGRFATSMDGAAGFGVPTSGDGGGGGGGGGGAGVAGQYGADGNAGGGGAGGTNGVHFYNTDNTKFTWPSAVEILSPQYGSLNSNSVLDPRNFYGYGGAAQATGANGAISIFWTTAATAPTDWGLLDQWPDPVVQNTLPSGTVNPIATVSLPGGISLGGTWGTGWMAESFLSIHPDGWISYGKTYDRQNQFTEFQRPIIILNNQAAGSAIASRYKFRFWILTESTSGGIYGGAPGYFPWFGDAKGITLGSYKEFTLTRPYNFYAEGRGTNTSYSHSATGKLEIYYGNTLLGTMSISWIA